MRHLRISVRTIEIGMVVLLACAVAAAAAQSHAYFRAAKKGKAKTDYLIESSTGNKPLFDVRNVAAGDSGRAKITLTNRGRKPARIRTKRIRMSSSALTPYLNLSIYDTTTKQCLYPRPKKAPKPIKKGNRLMRPKPTGPCTTVAPWKNLSAFWDLPPKPVGKFVRFGIVEQQWKPREKHTIEVRWQVAANAPNTTQGQTAGFTLRWYARPK